MTLTCPYKYVKIIGITKTRTTAQLHIKTKLIFQNVLVYSTLQRWIVWYSSPSTWIYDRISRKCRQQTLLVSHLFLVICFEEKIFRLVVGLLSLGLLYKDLIHVNRIIVSFISLAYYQIIIFVFDILFSSTLFKISNLNINGLFKLWIK